MWDATRTGRTLLGVGIAAMGAQRLLIGKFLPELDAVPQWFPAPVISAYVLGALLFGLGACIAIGYRLRTAATTLAGVLFAIVVLFHVPRLIANIGNGGAWTGAMEIFALGAAGLIAAERWIVPARLMFGVTLPGFGIPALHLPPVRSQRDPRMDTGTRLLGVLHGTGAHGGRHRAAHGHARPPCCNPARRLDVWFVGDPAPRTARAGGPAQSRRVDQPLCCTALCGGAWLIVGTLSRVGPGNHGRAASER